QIALAAVFHPIGQPDQASQAQLLQRSIEAIARYTRRIGMELGIPRFRPGIGDETENGFQILGGQLGHSWSRCRISRATVRSLSLSPAANQPEYGRRVVDPKRHTQLPRSHALRGNARRDALRYVSHSEPTQSVEACVPTQSVGTRANAPLPSFS